jgi:hypothetical protein
MIISSEVNPKEIIKCTTHEWARTNRQQIQIEELQFVDSETVATLYKVSKLSPKDVLLAELKKILHMAQAKAREYDLNEDLYNILMDMDVAIGETMPDMTLRAVQAKLKGENVSTFNRLSNRAQYAQKTWHLEVAGKHATKMKGLVQMAKDYGYFEH